VSKLTSIYAFIIFIFFHTLTSVSANEETTIEIRTIEIPPYGIQDENGTSGIYYDIANLLTEESGYKSNNFVYPYARIVSELKSGETDLTIMFKYQELEEYVIYIAPLTTLKTVVVGLKGTSITSIESLKGKTIAYLRGAKFSDQIDSDPEINTQSTTDFVQGMKMLKHRRVDAIIGPLDPILIAEKSIAENQAILGIPFIVDERTPWIQISKKNYNKLSVDRLREKFLELNNQGKIDSIRNRYIDSQ